jgi:small conductance mechanosensitive channel
VQIGSNIGTVRELSLFWTELMTDDKVQIIVPNAGVWGQPLRNFSAYPAAHAGEVRFRVAETTPLDPVLDGMRQILDEHPRVLSNPAPTVLLDREATENALEIVVGFATAEDEVAAVKSDLIKSVHDMLGIAPEAAPAWRPRRHA